MKDQTQQKKQDNSREETSHAEKRAADSARRQKSAAFFTDSLANCIAHGIAPKTDDPALLEALGQIGNMASAALLSGRRSADDALEEAARSNTFPPAHAALLSSFITEKYSIPENSLADLPDAGAARELPAEIADGPSGGFNTYSK
jgi:hypothetical protein